MRINSQNNQFIFNFPQGFITKEVDEKFQVLLDKNFIPYNDVMDYINSTIKDLVFPSISFETVEQKLYHGKNIRYRSAGNIADKFQGEIDVTFRSVDSHLNYFILLEISSIFYLSKNPNHLDTLSIEILDKDGDVLYTILLRETLITSLSDLRLSYNATSFDDHDFTLQIAYNFIDIIYGIETDSLISDNIFDIEKEDRNYMDTTLIDIEKEKRDNY